MQSKIRELEILYLRIIQYRENPQVLRLQKFNTAKISKHTVCVYVCMYVCTWPVNGVPCKMFALLVCCMQLIVETFELVVFHCR